jgi:uncharacterized Zn-binding protein involved in type VI secretion
MPGIVRVNEDTHIGHASPTPNPFHRTSYKDANQSTVYVNGELAVVVGGKTACKDPAVGSSPNVYCEGILVHRKDDATGGHTSWKPNKAATGSETVFANGE